MPQKPYKYEAWPAWMYGPGGKAEIFEREEDVPRGWVDHPSKVKETTAEEPSRERKTPKDFSNKEAAISYLREQGVKIAKNASDQKVIDALHQLGG